MSESKVQQQPVEEGRLSPGFLLLASWIILIFLIHLFGYDVNMWAFSSDSPFMEKQVLPVTDHLSRFATDSGLRQLRTDVETTVQPIYDDSPVIAEIAEPE